MLEFKIEGNEAKINIYQLLHDGIPDSRKQELAESLTCTDFVIKAVIDQVLDGWTENGFHGPETCTTETERFSPLQKARRRIAEGASETARKEIKRLQGQLDRERKYKNEYMNKYFELYHSGYQPVVPRSSYNNKI